ncbi:hypothetical protein C8R46DRAFT_1030539 [Mycena filopes]|nr:hypothetical protein C8R46DRAFT_1030539 [Mycena filopes]
MPHCVPTPKKPVKQQYRDIMSRFSVKIAEYALEKVSRARAGIERVTARARDSFTQTLETLDVPFDGYDYAKFWARIVRTSLALSCSESRATACHRRGPIGLNTSGRVANVLTQHEFPSIVEAARAKTWIASPGGHEAIKAAFRLTS